MIRRKYPDKPTCLHPVIGPSCPVCGSLMVWSRPLYNPGGAKRYHCIIVHPEETYDDQG